MFFSTNEGAFSFTLIIIIGIVMKSTGFCAEGYQVHQLRNF